MGLIGPGFLYGHYAGEWISGLARLGTDCSTSPVGTICVAHYRASGKALVLGDRVWIGTNSVITGPITVGSGALNGATAIVAASNPDNGIELDVPAWVIGHTGFAKLASLPGKHYRTAED